MASTTSHSAIDCTVASSPPASPSTLPISSALSSRNSLPATAVAAPSPTTPPPTIHSGSTHPYDLHPQPAGRTHTWFDRIRQIPCLSKRASMQLGWSIALLGLVFTISTLAPTFRSQFLSEEALRIAKWTEIKDFLEYCRQQAEERMFSAPCLAALGQELPPPPGVDVDHLDDFRRNVPELNRTSPHGTEYQEHHGPILLGAYNYMLYLGLLLTLYLCWLRMSRFAFTLRVWRLARSNVPQKCDGDVQNLSVGATVPPSEPGPVLNTSRALASAGTDSLRRRRTET